MALLVAVAAAEHEVAEAIQEGPDPSDAEDPSADREVVHAAGVVAEEVQVHSDFRQT